MSRMMVQAAVTMNQLQSKLDVIGHNLANSQTTGYKNRQTEFSSLLRQQINNLNDPANAEGRVTPDGVRVGSGARLGSIQLDLSQGVMLRTDRELDTALLGDNRLYEIQVEDGGRAETQYTRDGAFYLNPTEDGAAVMLTTRDGHPVLSAGGPIVIEAGFESISILETGEINVVRNGQTDYAGQISVVEALRPKLLEAVGNNHFRVPDLDALGFDFADVISNVNPNEAVLQSHVLEGSNVDLAQEMSEMILMQRSYQMNARTISMADQMMGLVNQVR